MKDQRKHYGPKVFGGYRLEGYLNEDTGAVQPWHVKYGNASFLVHGDTIRDATATSFENGMVATRPTSTGTSVPTPLRAAILEAVKEWELEKPVSRD